MRIVIVSLVLLAAVVLAAAVGARPDLRPIVLTAHSGTVKPGKEKQLCYRRTFPRDHDMDVGRIEMRVRGGSHHVHLYRPQQGTIEYPPHDCPFAVDFSKWGLVAATQNPRLDWSLPPGVAIDFPARQPLMIQTHYVNSSLLRSRGNTRAKIILHPVDSADVRAHAGAIFGQDRTVSVPPGIHTAASPCALTGDPARNHQMTVIALTGHYHFRGVRFQVWHTAADGSRIGPPVYDHEGYADPEFRQYSPGELVLEPGEGLEWECTWENDTTRTFEFGPNTQMNEHCNLFGFYYPSDAPQESVDCIHMNVVGPDGQPEEKNIRCGADGVECPPNPPPVPAP
jgi:hypothetical protein